MRITVVEQNGSGGLIHYAFQFCAALAEEGHNVTLITARIYELRDFPHTFKVDTRLNLWPLFDPMMEKPPRGWVEKIWRKVFWEIRRAYRAGKLMYAWFDLTRHLLSTRPDIVQFGKINFPFEAYFLSRMKRGGLVLTQICHEFERRESSGALARYFDRLYASIYRSFSAIFFHAHQNRERFHAVFDIPRDRTFVIHHGNENLFLDLASGLKPETNLRVRYGIASDEPVILFFGLIAPSKGLPLLLEAFEVIAARSKAKLVIAGYPAKQMDMGLLREQAAASATPDRIIFDTRYIPLEEVAPLMRLADVVIFPYQSSTQSGSLQIAYSFGRPVVATSVGGLVEAVEEGKTGFLVPPDDANLMAERVLSILGNPQLAAEMGQYSKHLSDTRFNWKSVARNVSEIYRGLLAEKLK